MKSLSLSFALTFCAATCFAQTKADSLKAAAIFSKSKDAYAHLKTYIDSGRVSNSSSNGHSSKDIVFKTVYSGNDFNFEYYQVGSPKSLYTINRTANMVKSWWGVPGKVGTPVNLVSALRSASGVSSSSSYLIPGLLFSSDFKNQNLYAALQGISIIGNEKVNGQDCFKIEGRQKYDLKQSNGLTVIWIARKDYLIRKIETTRTLSPAKTEASLRNAIALGKARGLNYSNLEKALKMYHDTGIRDSLRGHPRRPYTSKATLVYFPTVNRKVSPALLKFRPNRVAGS